MKKRSTEPEAVFGQMKYNSRFRRFGKDTVKADFAIAFNWGKMTKNVGCRVEELKQTRKSDCQSKKKCKIKVLINRHI
jgi:hypothetical protein